MPSVETHRKILCQSEPFDSCGSCDQDTVLVAERVTFADSYPSHQILVMAHSGEPNKRIELSIRHIWGSWGLYTRHHHTPDADEFSFMLLPDAIAEFERRVGVTLPHIEIIE